MQAGRLSVISSFLILIIFSGCEVRDGDDRCEYEYFSDTVFIKNLFIKEDFSIGNVTFQHVDTLIKYPYEVDEHELAYIQKNFTVESLNSKRGIFLIEGSHIKNGTCTPYTIEKITVLK